MNETIASIQASLEAANRVAKENLDLFVDAYSSGSKWVDVKNTGDKLEIGRPYLIRRTYKNENPEGVVLTVWEINGWREVVGRLRSTHATKASIDVWI